MMLDIAIIGGGVAGLGAAWEAGRLGLSACVFERDEAVGGIVRYCSHKGFGKECFGALLTGQEYLQRLHRELSQYKVSLRTRSSVLSIDSVNKLWNIKVLSPDKGMETIPVRAFVLAAGSYEQTREQLEIPGTRPAGVFSGIQATQLANAYTLGKRVVIQGYGGIELCISMLQNYEIAGTFEQCSRDALQPYTYAAYLGQSPATLYNREIIQIHGSARLEAVTVAESLNDSDGSYASEETIACDTAILSGKRFPDRHLLHSLPLYRTITKSTKAGAENRMQELAKHGILCAGDAHSIQPLADHAIQNGKQALRAAACFFPA